MARLPRGSPVTLEISLPNVDGTTRTYRLIGSPPDAAEGPSIEARKAFAAAHLVADPMADVHPEAAPVIDWDATLQFRRYLWSLGLGVAEAMDTAQRGMGLDWDTSKELIKRSISEAGPSDLLASGAGTDQLAPEAARSMGEVIAAYETQVGYVEGLGGRVVLMASRALASVADGVDDYVSVYSKILSQVSEPVIIHWLGDMFDPALGGYWGTNDVHEAIATVAALVEQHAASVDGVKVSLLDARLEIELRDRLPEGVRLYTGDDFNYPDLIFGDGERHSDALLGIFDPIAPVASAALRALGGGDVTGYWSLLEPTKPLARHVFAAPTRFYKTGVVFIAYLNGHQDHFRMVGGQESARSLPHLIRLFELADAGGVLIDPELAVQRMGQLLALGGFE